MKLLLGTSLLVAAGTVSALDLAHDGVGDAHYVPFYDLRDGKSTQFEIQNRWNSPKIARVVVTESLYGRSVLEFNVYLAGNDTFTAALGGSAQAPALITFDHTCTHGLLVGSTPLGLSPAEQATTGNTPAQLRMGAIEVFEVGSWNPQPEAGQSTTSHAWFCSQVERNFAGKWRDDPNADVQPPTGTLAVTAQVIDARTGSNHSPIPIAIREFSHSARHASPAQTDAIRLYKPQPEPGATKFEVAGRYRFPLSRPQDAASMLFVDTTAIVPIASRGPTAARTEFVVSFPTRRAYLPRSLGGLLDGPAEPPFDQPQLPDSGPDCTRWDWLAFYGDIEAWIRLPATPQCAAVATQRSDELDRRVAAGEFAGRVTMQFNDPYPAHMPAEIEGVAFPDFVEGLPAVTRSVRTFHTPHPVDGSHTFVIVDAAWAEGAYMHR